MSSLTTSGVLSWGFRAMAPIESEGMSSPSVSGSQSGNVSVALVVRQTPPLTVPA